MADARRPAMLARAREAVRGMDYATAEAICRDLTAANRKDADALDVLSEVAWQRGDPAASLECLRAAVRIEPKNPRLRTNLGRAHMRIGRYGQALVQFDAALKIAPDDPVTLAEKATVYEMQNKHDRARRVLEPAMAGAKPSPIVAAVHLRLLIRDKAFDDAIDLGTRVSGAGHPPSMALRNLHFELARALERSQRYDESFAAARRANEMLTPAFDPERERAFVDEIIRTFDRGTLAALPRPADPSEVPVFVFGMPRSGTTLVERIIDAHPGAHGAGEAGRLEVIAGSLGARIGSSVPFPTCVRDLAAEDVERESKAYLDHMILLAPRAERIVDKSLGTWMHVGLIDVLLPQARVIHCLRDPLDTCLSCFMERLAPESHIYANDLRHLGLHYRQYERLMRHWKDVISVEFLEIVYEDLTADQEGVSRRIIEFCGLDWDDACLRFHESAKQDRTLSYDQVRKPIYRTSVGRAERFGALLDPLRAALAEGE